MSLTLPVGTRGRLLALSLLLLAIGIAWLALGAPLAELYAERSDRLVAREAMAARMEGIAATLPDLKARQADGARPSTAALIEADTDALGAARLQDLIKAAAGETGIALASVETLPTEAAGDARRLGLRLNLTGSYSAIVDLIGRIQQAPTALLIDGLEIHNMSAEPGATADTLRATFSVFAFRAATPQAAPAPGAGPS